MECFFSACFIISLLLHVKLMIIHRSVVIGKVNTLREAQSASGEELRPFFGRTLISCPKGTSSLSAASGIPSVLDRMLKGAL